MNLKVKAAMYEYLYEKTLEDVDALLKKIDRLDKEKDELKKKLEIWKKSGIREVLDEIER